MNGAAVAAVDGAGDADNRLSNYDASEGDYSRQKDLVRRPWQR